MVFRIDGSVGKKSRRVLFQELNRMVTEGKSYALLATSSLLGEGSDLPELDALFLAMPISFKGRLIQYAGRLHRRFAGKTEVRIYDYVETDHLDCVRSWRPQRPGRQDSWSDLRRQPNSRVRRHDGCIARKIHLKNDADRQANSLGRTSRIMNLTLAV
jgi:superfamily II DNA or RNA helicase